MSERPKVDKEYIEQCSDGWIKKIENLYSLIKETLENNNEVQCNTNQSMTMHEGLMIEHQVLPKKVPILDLFVKNQLKATFKPIGLWVVGANGRVDILTSQGAYILVDVGEDEITPCWEVFPPKNRKNSVPFDVAFIAKLVH